MCGEWRTCWLEPGERLRLSGDRQTAAGLPGRPPCLSLAGRPMPCSCRLPLPRPAFPAWQPRRRRDAGTRSGRRGRRRSGAGKWRTVRLGHGRGAAAAEPRYLGRLDGVGNAAALCSTRPGRQVGLNPPLFQGK